MNNNNAKNVYFYATNIKLYKRQDCIQIWTCYIIHRFGVKIYRFWERFSNKKILSLDSLEFQFDTKQILFNIVGLELSSI